MAAASVVQLLVPQDFVRGAIEAEFHPFCLQHSDTQLLLVSLRNDAALAEGLGATATGAGAPLKPSEGAMSFYTATAERDRPASAPAGEAFGPPDLQRLVRLRGRHFVLPLRKREGVQAAFSDRVSVGRARNKDVVLRHESVSKFHAWFEVDDRGVAYIADAGSKNGTTLAGERLTPRKLTPVQSGQNVDFGAVEATVCSPGIFWRALHPQI